MRPRQDLTFNSFFCLIHVFFYPLVTFWRATTQQTRLCVCGLHIGWSPALNFPALNKIYLAFSPFQGIWVAADHTHNPQGDSHQLEEGGLYPSTQEETAASEQQGHRTPGRLPADCHVEPVLSRQQTDPAVLECWP